MKIKIKNRYCEFTGFYFFLVLFLNNKILVDLFRILSSNMFPGISGIIELLRNFLYIACTLYVFINILVNKVDKELIYITSFVFMILIISNLITPSLSTFWLNNLLLFFSRVYVGFFFFRYAEDYNKIIEYQKYYLIPTLFYAFLINSIGQTYGYMAMSYNLLPSALMFFFYGKNNKKRIYMISSIYMLLIIFVYGSRGALVCAICSLIFYYIFIIVKRRMSVYSVVITFVGFVLGIIIIMNLDNLFKYLLNNFGFSRTILHITSGNIFNDSNRSTFQKIFIDDIIKSPFKMNGVFSDRIRMSYIYGRTLGDNGYPHNLIIEVLYQFGLIFGLLFIILMAYYFVRGLKTVLKCNNSNLNIIFFSFAFTTYIQLMVSGSYLTSYFWGITMGLTVNLTRNAILKNKLFNNNNINDK